MKTIQLFILLFIIPFSILAQKAALKGKVVDAFSNQPLPFVNVVVSGTTTGTITDLDGNFLITGLEAGFVRIEASFVGYKKAISSEIEVSVANTNSIEIKMEEQKEQIEEVTVTASPFRKTKKARFRCEPLPLAKLKKARAPTVIFRKLSSRFRVCSQPLLFATM
jgi:hypothetical protein